MIQISQLKLDITHTKEDLERAIQKALKKKTPIIDYKITKKSIDARKKNEIKFIYSVEVEIPNEEVFLKKGSNKNIMLTTRKEYTFPITGTAPLQSRPVIVGLGPAGLFCGLMLAQAGYAPIIIERGADVDMRVKDIEQFWESAQLKAESNVQFGEGGAGTFSDGKLNTLVKDKYGRNKKVLETFVQYGAPKEILYMNKPHIGTDLLREVVKNIRKAIISFGGEVRFHTRLDDLIIEKGQLREIIVNQAERIPCNQLILAVGHSARDTFSMLYKHQLTMKQKSFAIGLRIEHEADMINQSQYGTDYSKEHLPTADYKLAYKAKNGRNVYSFCMCPGGFVVNSSSEPGRLVVNGMSNYKRDAHNSNSAIIVNVTPSDFASDEPLAGVQFQRHWEEMAYKAGGSDGKIPVQLFDDFRNNQTSKQFGKVKPCIKGQYRLSNLNQCLPSFVIDAIIDGVLTFETKIKGFSRGDCLLSGVETRTSSPVRIERDDIFESNIKGIYPCGEGAGYAGGITSAAIDGIKAAEAIADRYKPLD